ncbi:MAG: hypothetical protein JST92_08620, partial [Deltaproteobacteria bacterium]|nr:hypothetical protein [Deltaproteobacteria bacterium]
MSLLLAVLLLAASVDEGLPLETVPQLGHAKSIDAMAYSADGRYFVSADQERALVWEVRSGRLLRAIRHAGMMRRDRGAALTADGARLFVGGNVYDVRTGKLLHHLEGATIATSDGLTAAGLGGIFDTASGQRVKAFPRVSECADPMVTDVTADRKLLAVHCMATSGQTSFFVRVVDADTGAKVVQPYEGRPIYNGLNVGIFSPNGKFLVTVGHTPDSPNNDHASVVEIASGKLLADISSTASSVSFRAGTQQLILFGTNLREGVQQVEAYDLRAPRDPVWKLQSLQLIETGAVSPDGEAILFGGTDKLVHRAQASTGAEVATRSGAIEDVQQLAFLADGTLAVQTQASWTSQRGSLRLWDLAGARQTEVLEANGLTLLDGGRVALARGQPLDQPLERTAPIATRLIELPSLRDRFSRPFTPQTGLRAEGAAVLSPHGKYLFVLDRSNDKGSFAMLDAKTGAELMTLPKREASYDLIGVDEAEKTAFVRAPLETAKDGNSREQEYLLIDLASTRVVRRYPRAQLDCGALVLPTPDGAYWALEQGSGNGSERFLLVIDSATGSIREVHPKTAFGVVPRFTQDHLLFFTTGLDKKGEMVRLHALDLESLKERWALKL